VHCFAKLYKVMSVYGYFRISMAYSAYLSIFDIFGILIIFCLLQRELMMETKHWEVKDHRTGENVPLRADRWFQKDPSADSVMSSGDFQAFESTYGTMPRFDASLHTFWLEVALTTGVNALRWKMILHGNAGEMGKYAVLSVLPDKIARFLYEYHDT
jgi:hypothetical protein